MSLAVRALFGASVILGGCRPSTPPTSPPSAPASSSPPIAQAELPRGDDQEPPPNRPPSVARTEPQECNPFVAPLERKAGTLTVHAPPDPDERRFPGRMRNHVDGALTLDSPRLWVGPQVPGFMPLMDGTKELFLLEREGDVFVGLYRDPYGASSCDLSTPRNCDYSVLAFNACGDALWAFALAPLMSAGKHLEVGDMRYVDGIVYFNEACQSYAKQAKRKCSALVAFDPASTEVKWRTKNLVSRGPFLVLDQYIVSGYGFTAEKDFLYIIRRSDGEVVGKVDLKSAHDDLTIEDDTLIANTYKGTEQFTMTGFDGPKPKLTRLR